MGPFWLRDTPQLYVFPSPRIPLGPRAPVRFRTGARIALRRKVREKNSTSPNAFG